MSKKCYVHTKHEIEYGSARFNWNQNAVFSTLTLLGIEAYDSDEGSGNGDDVELNRADVERAVSGINAIIAGSRPYKRYIEHQLYRSLQVVLPHCSSRQQAIVEFRDILQLWLDESPSNYEYIYLSWF